VGSEHVDAGRWASVAERLSARGGTLSVAESCTGGLFAATIVSVPGASRCFAGGVVAYSDAAKQSVLGVSVEAMRQHGAVSEPTALAMAVGCRAAFDTDVAVAITGIAGPEGGSASKPVGLVYVARSTASGTVCRVFRFGGDRSEVRRRAVCAAIDLVDEWLSATVP